MSLAPKVLVVDDEPDVRLYLRTLLSDNGFEVNEAADADEAMEQLDQQRPDAIILDIMMPGRSGVTLFNKIRKSGGLEGVCVIVLSGVHERFVEDFKSFFDTLKLGKPAAFLDKPVDPEQLLSLLRESLGTPEPTGDGQ
jgi:CheY-like chemotaxis protein